MREASASSASPTSRSPPRTSRCRSTRARPGPSGQAPCSGCSAGRRLQAETAQLGRPCRPGRPRRAARSRSTSAARSSAPRPTTSSSSSATSSTCPAASRSARAVPSGSTSRPASPGPLQRRSLPSARRRVRHRSRRTHARQERRRLDDLEPARADDQHRHRQRVRLRRVRRQPHARPADGTLTLADVAAANGIGILLSGVNLGLVIMKEASILDRGAWRSPLLDLAHLRFYALTADAATAAIVGIPEVTATASTLQVRVNKGEAGSAWLGNLVDASPIVDFQQSFGVLGYQVPLYDQRNSDRRHPVHPKKSSARRRTRSSSRSPSSSTSPAASRSTRARRSSSTSRLD